MAIFLLMTIPSLVAQSNATDLDDLRALLITPPTEQERQLLSIDPSFAIKLERDPVYKSEFYSDDVQLCRDKISFQTPWGDRTTGYIYKPLFSLGPRPGVLALSGSPGHAMSISTFSRDLAKKGFIVLFFNALPTRLPKDRVLTPEVDIQGDIALIKEYRVALHILRTLPEVDKNKLGVCGVSMGGIFGSPLAGLELDVKAFLYQISLPGLVHPSLLGRPLGNFLETQKSKMPRETYIQTMKSYLAYEGIRYTQVPRTAPILWQNTTGDNLLKKSLVDSSFELSGGPKQQIWYPGGHGVSDQMSQDGIAWLLEELN